MSNTERPDVKGLLDLATDSRINCADRIRAIRRLESTSEHRDVVIDDLFPVIDDGNVPVRHAAIVVLGLLARHAASETRTRVEAAILERMAGKDVRVALDALLFLGEHSVQAKAKLDELFDDDDDYVSYAAATGLLVTDPHNEKAIHRIIESAADSPWGGFGLEYIINKNPSIADYVFPACLSLNPETRQNIIRLLPERSWRHVSVRKDISLLLLTDSLRPWGLKAVYGLTNLGGGPWEWMFNRSEVPHVVDAVGRQLAMRIVPRFHSHATTRSDAGAPTPRECASLFSIHERWKWVKDAFEQLRCLEQTAKSIADVPNSASPVVLPEETDRDVVSWLEKVPRCSSEATCESLDEYVSSGKVEGVAVMGRCSVQPLAKALERGGNIARLALIELAVLGKTAAKAVPQIVRAAKDDYLTPAALVALAEVGTPEAYAGVRDIATRLSGREVCSRMVPYLTAALVQTTRTDLALLRPFLESSDVCMQETGLGALLQWPSLLVSPASGSGTSANRQ